MTYLGSCGIHWKFEAVIAPRWKYAINFEVNGVPTDGGVGLINRGHNKSFRLEY